MEAQPSIQSAGDQGGSHTTLREIISDAVAFWERRRIPYNMVLTAVFLAWVGFTWPHFRPAFTLQSAFLLAVLATMANLCYCAAYVADIPMQYSSFQSSWRRWRWGLWLAGMLLAVLIANYWIVDEIYPFVR